MKKQHLGFVLPLWAMTVASLVACSSSTSKYEDEDNSDALLQAMTENDLPDCDGKTDGALYYVWEVQAAFRCSDEKWIKLKTEYVPPTDTVVSIVTKKDTVIKNDTTVVKQTMCGESPYDSKIESCFDNEVIIPALCNKNNKGKTETGTNDQKYICVSDGTKFKWREVTEVEEVLSNNECTPENEGITTKFGYSNYICDAEKGWTFDYNDLEEGTLTIGEKVYKTVGVGKQMWMAENLNYTDSTAYPNLKGQVSCYGKNEDTNCEALGAYYSWTAAMDFPEEYADSIVSSKIKSPHRGICPEGWHIPSLKDWSMLNDFVIGTNETDTTAGTGLKSTTSWKDIATATDTTSGNGNNAYGFNGIAAGTIKYTPPTDSTAAKFTSTEKGTFALFISADELPCTYQYVDNAKCIDNLTPIRVDLRFDEISLRYLQSETYSRRTRMSVRCVSDTYKD